MRNYTIATSYKILKIDDTASLKMTLSKICDEMKMKGTIIVSCEGINFTVMAENDDTIAQFYSILEDCGIPIGTRTITYCDFPVFKKMKVKIRKEIVNYRLEDVESIIGQTIGNHCSPEEWDNLLQDPKSIVIDVRNYYEYALGTFQGAINPKTNSFSEFAEWFQNESKNWDDDAKIVIFCTGGIRCEKSGVHIRNWRKNAEIYHLNGGIINYLAAKHSGQSAGENMWVGSLFVFDDRIAISSDLQPINKLNSL